MGWLSRYSLFFHACLNSSFIRYVVPFTFPSQLHSLTSNKYPVQIHWNERSAESLYMGNQILKSLNKRIFQASRKISLSHSEKEDIILELSNENFACSILLRRWKEIISDGKIKSLSKDNNGNEISYGLRMKGDIIEEFCEDVVSGEDFLLSNVGTLQKYCGDYSVFLAQNRRLRPPAAPKLSELPPHNEEKCSMCTGPIRLEIREKVAQLKMSESERVWDCHFNISPMTPQGHFLLVPDLEKAENRRAQRLTLEDCIDLVDMGRQLPEMCINYNSPNAGASQNHIHLHAWVHGQDEEPYPSQQAPVDPHIAAVHSQDHSVKVFTKDYPASCIVLEGKSATQIGTVMHQILNLANEVDLAYNVAAFEGEAYIFLRLKEAEIVKEFVPDLKIGSCQILGLWAVDTEAQFHSLTEDSIKGALERTKISTGLMNTILGNLFEQGASN
mmetsp:Transcript_8180/g.10835  ORF Transcript_8180/g.10835 Transcript_8180/m.10835 type:complete len:444 (+) Transcript_8180:76-1407(+)